MFVLCFEVFRFSFVNCFCWFRLRAAMTPHREPIGMSPRAVLVLIALGAPPLLWVFQILHFLDMFCVISSAYKKRGSEASMFMIHCCRLHCCDYINQKTHGVVVRNRACPSPIHLLFPFLVCRFCIGSESISFLISHSSLLFRAHHYAEVSKPLQGRAF